MTAHVVDHDTLGRISRKQWELTRRVLEGTLDPNQVEQALQGIIENRSSILVDNEYKYFSSPVLVRVEFEKIANDRGWQFSEQALNDLFDQVVRYAGFKSDLTSVFSLDIWLGDMEETLNEICVWLSRRHAFKFDRHMLELLSGLHLSAKARTELPDRYVPGEVFVRPVIVNLQDNVGKSPREVTASNLGGIETMVAFAANRHLVRYPGMGMIWLPAFEFAANTQPPNMGIKLDDKVPFLYTVWGKDTVQAELHLSMDGGYVRVSEQRVPTFKSA